MQAARKPTNLSMDATLLDEARGLGVNLSRAAEAGLREAVRAAKAEAWRRENRAALESTNNWVEVNGLPLAKHRLF